MFVAGAHSLEPPVQNFVRTLFSLANGPYEATLIEWSEDGRRIIVRDMDLFASSISAWKSKCPGYVHHGPIGNGSGERDHSQILEQRGEHIARCFEARRSKP